jgi:hypothetical protein
VQFYISFQLPREIEHADVSLSVFANDRFSQWKMDIERGHTILKSKKGPKRCPVPTLCQLTKLYLTLCIEKGIAVPLTIRFFLKRVL